MFNVICDNSSWHNINDLLYPSEARLMQMSQPQLTLVFPTHRNGQNITNDKYMSTTIINKGKLRGDLCFIALSWDVLLAQPTVVRVVPLSSREGGI